MTRGGREGGLVVAAFNGGDMAGGEAVSVAIAATVGYHLLLFCPSAVAELLTKRLAARGRSATLILGWVLLGRERAVGANKVDDCEEESRVY